MPKLPDYSISQSPFIFGHPLPQGQASVCEVGDHIHIAVNEVAVSMPVEVFDLMVVERFRAKQGMPTHQESTPCPDCKDTGIIDTGNNDLPCKCPASDEVKFNVVGRGQIKGSVLKAEQ